MVKYYCFEDEPSTREQLQQSLKTAREDAATHRDSQQWHAFAIRVGDVVSRASSQPDLSELNANELVEWAEESHRQVRSQGTFSTLGAALALRAHLTLAKSFPQYASEAERTRRSFTPYVTVTLAAGHESALGEAARTNDDVLRMAELLKQRIERFPRTRGAASWAFLRPLDPEAAESAAEYVKADPIDWLAREGYLATTPDAMPYAIYEYWGRLARGEATAQAREDIDLAASAGVPSSDFLLGWATP